MANKIEKKLVEMMGVSKMEILKNVNFTDPFLAHKRYTLYNDEPGLAYNIHTYDNTLVDHLVC